MVKLASKFRKLKLFLIQIFDQLREVDLVNMEVMEEEKMVSSSWLGQGAFMADQSEESKPSMLHKA